MKNKNILIVIVIFCSVVVLLPWTVACSPQKPPGVINILGPGDLYCFADAVNNSNINGTSVEMNTSDDEIKALKRGDCDAVLLGREPSSDELQGLSDNIIAYDAVCVIIDEHSYEGGVSSQTKTSGLKELSINELREIFDGGWQWNGEYYVKNPTLDPSSWLATVDYIAWLRQPKTITSSFNFPVGKFDTQTVLYQEPGAK